jgi:hypothetical protein
LKGWGREGVEMMIIERNSQVIVGSIEVAQQYHLVIRLEITEFTSFEFSAELQEKALKINPFLSSQKYCPRKF